MGSSLLFSRLTLHSLLSARSWLSFTLSEWFLGRVKILLAEPFLRSVVLHCDKKVILTNSPFLKYQEAGALIAFLQAASASQGCAFPFYCLLFLPPFGEEEGLGHPWDGQSVGWCGRGVAGGTGTGLGRWHPARTWHTHEQPPAVQNRLLPPAFEGEFKP